MAYLEQYRSKRARADDAVGLVRDGDTIVVPTAAGEPPALLTALSEARRRLRGVTVSQILPARGHAYFDPETAGNVRHAAYFFGSASRPGGQAGWIDYHPCNFSEIPVMIRRGLMPADVVFSLASPMDGEGNFALGLAPDYTLAAVSRARAVVLEVNPNVPYACGNCRVHVSQVAAIVEDESPLLEAALPEIGPAHEAIGRYVAELVEDRSTLQIGYGAIPDAVVVQLAHKRDLGIHTEMLGDGILRLVESGAVTNRRKNFLPDRMAATFALGSRKLYRFIDRNPAVEMHPADFTNDPCTAGRNDRLVAINASIEIDLFGQCASESIGTLPYSGTGGQSDFVRAANRSEGGKAIIVMPSTARDGAVSRIVPVLRPGAHVSTSKNDVNYVVTEYGVAQLRGKPAKQRARALIALAHPRFRDELAERAAQMRLL